MQRRALIGLLGAVWLGGCALARFDVPGAADEGAYAAANPYYAEFCALSQIKKKVGFGADIRGEIGGHSVFYLNGACRVAGEEYPVLEVCAPTDGVGLSMNEHFANAKWVATPGRAFFFTGGMRQGETLTQARYGAVQEEAKRLDIYRGVRFRPFVFKAMPAGWAARDWMYEMSVATDYAVGMGRGRDCARVPVTRAQMGRMVAFLNKENAPYRAGEREFRWSVFNDNCIHLAHNALAAAGLWDAWPIERFLLIAILDFPVPKNEFVNIMRWTNDEWLPDPGAVYRKVPARGELLADGRLPTFPGALAEARAPQMPNEVYDTDLKLIFYDEPTFGSYQGWFDRIFLKKRYSDERANRAAFARLAQEAVAARQPLDWWLAREPFRRDPAGFALVYAAYYRAVGELAAVR